MENLSRVLVYSVSTDAFFNDEESKLGKLLMDLRIMKNELMIIKDKKQSHNKKLNYKLDRAIRIIAIHSNEEKSEIIESVLEKIKQKENERKADLNVLLESNQEKRLLRRDSLFTYRNGKEINISSKVVALFESSFTRTLKLSEDNVNESVVIVKAYHYATLKDLINDGFSYMGHDYIYFSSSSGQMKNKKCVFVRKDLWDEHKGTFLCGLSWERINNTAPKEDKPNEKGININKFLAYLSLQNTATTMWNDFDINRVIVCPDLEVDVTDIVEYINRDTYEIDPPKEMTLPMNVSDGVGLISSELSNTNFQFRIPWGKGLLTSYPIKKHARLLNQYHITDVWGDIHHVDDVDIILSASQLKTWRYYNSMDEYRQHFTNNHCEAGKCNEETDSNWINLSYQFLQSLVDMQPHELDNIAKETNNDIHNLGNNKNVMLRSLGATDENDKKDYFQQALLMYPNMLNDSHARDMVKSRKKSMVNDALAGKLRVGGKRMFVLPDLHSYCEFVLTGQNCPKGLLNKGEVFAKDIRKGTVDLNRSPQLYMEHGIMESVKSNELSKWFTTGAIYVNNRDMVARLLQFDFDGDQIEVCTNKQYIEVARRNMEGIYPLYYEMSTAPIQEISKESIYKSLKLSFGGSIGSISNDITKIKNSPGEFTEDKLKAIKFLTMYNNFMIDFSKTNFLPKPPKHAKDLIKKYTSGDMPYFFQFAKGKDKVSDKIVKEYEDDKVISKYTPVVNMLEDIIADKRIHFGKVADKFDPKQLMSVNVFESKGKDLDQAIMKAYSKINRGKKWLIDKDADDYKENKYIYVAKVIKDEIMGAARRVNGKVSEIYVVNCLIYNLHKSGKSASKKTLWECFGDIIVANLNFNLNKIKTCQHCDGEFKAESHREKYCSDSCAYEGEKKKKRERARKARK